MKKILITALYLACTLGAYAQKKLAEATLPNGRVIVVFNDGTWMYRDIDPNLKSSNGNSKTTEYPSPSDKPLSNKSNSNKNSSTSSHFSSPSSSSYSSTCGARTKKGGYCKRVVKGGGRCWQH